MPVKLYYDNITAISITHSAVQYDRKKHVEINKHIIKEKFEAWVICMQFVPISQ